MKKLLLIACLVLLVFLAKRGIEALQEAAKQDDPVTRTIQRIDWTKEKVTALDTRFIQTQITAYLTTYERRPGSLQELVDAGLLSPKNIEDPWGNPYREEWTESELILTSKGEDAVFNTPDDLRHVIPVGSF